MEEEKIKLPEVTLWGCCWSDDAALREKTLRVLRYCQRHMVPGRVLFFSCAEGERNEDDGIERLKISKLDPQKWNVFVNYEVPKHIPSGFAMSVHEDGFPIEWNLWDPSFLKFDYIGSPWRDRVVGNGGLSIESEKLLKLKLKLPDNGGTIPSDYHICRAHRATLEKWGVRFAPWELALRFSTEQLRPDSRSFGFHGRRNRSKYDTGWAAIGRQERNAQPRRKCCAGGEPCHPPITGTGQPPRITVVYIHAPRSAKCESEVGHFIESYLQFPPLYPHDTVVVCNGFPVDDSIRARFAVLPNVIYHNHDNSGWDIGAYLAVSHLVTSDAQFCLGTPTFFRRSGWLKRIAEAWQRHGPGFYGTNAAFNFRPHINSTGFACPPEFLRSYPFPVVSKRERYDFEHSISKAAWVIADRAGYPAKLVTWDSEYDWPEWRSAPNIFHRGDQSNCLTYWNRHLNYEQASPAGKFTLARDSDGIPDPMFGSKNPSVTMVYVYACRDPRAEWYARRFSRSYAQFNPDYKHDTIVVCNGGPPDLVIREVFRRIPCKFVEHDNSGWDVGAYQSVCRSINTDAVLCMGGRTTVRRAGWLKKMTDAWGKFGRGMYGAFGSFQYGVKHIPTVGFLCPPTLIRQYPCKVETTAERSEFEHGPLCLTNLALHLGMKVRMVTQDGVWELDQVRKPKNVLNSGNQSNLLIYYTQADVYDEGDEGRRAILNGRVNGVLKA